MTGNTSEKLRHYLHAAVVKSYYFHGDSSLLLYIKFLWQFLGRDSGLQKVACVVNLVLIYEKCLGELVAGSSASPRACLPQARRPHLLRTEDQL